MGQLDRVIRRSAVVRADVWSKTSGKYRVRAVLLLALNLVLFVGLGCFTYWLRSGSYFPLTSGHYWDDFIRTFKPFTDEPITLIDVLQYPISFDAVPLQMVILGLLLAALVSIPILAAILYRFPISLLFSAIVAFFAMMPWLGLTLALCAFMASVWPFKFSFRYASALVALLPIIIYFISASRRSGQIVANVAPMEVVKFLIPWLFAIIASCALMAIVLAIAHWVDYRPGAITPLLVFMFALPVILFEFHIGRDELHYRILEHLCGPRTTPYSHFSPQEGGETLDKLARRLWERGENPDASLEGIRQNLELEWALSLENADDITHLPLSVFAEHQYEAAADCDWFVRNFPMSRYVPNVLYLKGRVLDMRVDMEVFKGEKRISFYDDFPARTSEETWIKLADNFPGSPLCAAALYRLATLDVRAGNVDKAVHQLRALLERFSQLDSPQPTPANPSWRELLLKEPTLKRLDLPLDSLLFDARRLLELVENNRDALRGNIVLADLMKCDPHDRHYADNLRALIAKYPASPLIDNIELERIRATHSQDNVELIRSLEAFIAQYPDADCLPEALYRLKAAYDSVDPAQGQKLFNEILRRFPDSIWRRKALEKQVTRSPQTTTTPVEPGGLNP